MGQRADLIIVRDGDWQHYYDHWCANMLDVDLFWGPELAVRFIEQRPPHEDRNEWLDEVWCEGAALVDLDEQVLLWFGGEDILYDIPRRRMHLTLMQKQWPDWEIRWAHHGLADIVIYLGLPKDLVLDTRVPSRDRAFRVWKSEDSNTTLITIHDELGVRAGRVYGGDEALRLGPDFFPWQDAATSTHLVWKGEFPNRGVHVDKMSKELWFWAVDTVYDPEERIAEAWPEWKILWLRDDFESHIEGCGVEVELPRVDEDALRASIQETVERSKVRKAGNPVLEALKKHYPGAKIELNPSTGEARGTQDLHTKPWWKFW